MIPEKYRNNTPESIEEIMAPFRAQGLFPAFPFGTDFTEEEVVLGKALRTFKAKAQENKLGAAMDIIGSWFSDLPAGAGKYISRMKLDNPCNFKEKIMQKVVVNALRLSGAV